MSTRDMNKKARDESGKKRFPFVLPESEIRSYVESLGIHDVSTAAARFQIIADLTKNAAHQLDSSSLQRIKRLAGEDSNRHYRRIMEAIIVSAGQNSQGINVAHLTANVAVQMIFRWSPEYFSALNNYREDLRRRKPLDRPSSRAAKRRSVLRLTNEY